MRTSRLPDVVPLRPGAKFYSASSMPDLMALASRLRQQSPVVKAHLAGHLNDMRVMMQPWFLRWSVTIGAKRKKCSEVEVWIMTYRRSEQGMRLAAATIEDTARWMVDGLDREQPNSVGGFSQREINFISGLLDLIPQIIEEIDQEAA